MKTSPKAIAELMLERYGALDEVSYMVDQNDGGAWGIRVTWSAPPVMPSGLMWHSANEKEANEVLTWIHRLTN